MGKETPPDEPLGVITDEVDKSLEGADGGTGEAKTSQPKKPAEAENTAFDVGDTSSLQMDATRLYLSEIGNAKLLTAEQEVYFSRLAQKGEIKARQRMIESNLRRW